MELANQLGSGIIASYFIECLKNAKWFTILEHFDTPAFKKFVGFVSALITTIGIHYAFDYNETGHGVLTVILPTGPEFFHMITDLAKQWAFQQFAYDVAVKGHD
jgi:hypothetical protein